MRTEFDPAKDAINIAKHGIFLAAAEQIEWDTLLAGTDDRANYGEVRMIGFAFIGDRLHCVIFTDRGNVRRVISLRKANRREIRRYAAT
jgi:uncharacterized DUF497 family protein